MLYSEKVMDHFRNPRNIGEIVNADGVGEVGNAKCGDIMRMYIKVENNTVNIQLCQTKYYSFIIKRVNNGKTDIIYDGKWQKCVTDSPKEGIYTYSVTPYYDNGKEKFVGAEIKLSPVNISFGDGNEPQIKIPDIANKDWYNQ